jgi:hypothetical protein
VLLLNSLGLNFLLL